MGCKVVNEASKHWTIIALIFLFLTIYKIQLENRQRKVNNPFLWKQCSNSININVILQNMMVIRRFFYTFYSIILNYRWEFSSTQMKISKLEKNKTDIRYLVWQKIWYLIWKDLMLWLRKPFHLSTNKIKVVDTRWCWDHGLGTDDP